MKKHQLLNIIKETIQELNNDILEKNNSCKEKGFCCRNMLTKKQNSAVLTKDACACPKGSVRINCPN